MKKLLILLAVIMMLSSSACGKAKISGGGETSSAVESTSEELSILEISSTTESTEEELSNNAIAPTILYGTETPELPMLKDQFFCMGHPLVEGAIKVIENNKYNHVVLYVSIAATEYMSTVTESDEDYESIRLKNIEYYCLNYWSEAEHGEALSQLRENGIDRAWVDKYGIKEWKQFEGERYDCELTPNFLTLSGISMEWSRGNAFGAYISPRQYYHLITMPVPFAIAHLPKDYDCSEFTVDIVDNEAAKEIIYGNDPAVAPESVVATLGVYCPSLYRAVEAHKGEDVLYRIAFSVPLISYQSPDAESEQDYEKRLEAIAAYCLSHWSEDEHGEALTALRQNGIDEGWVESYGNEE